MTRSFQAAVVAILCSASVLAAAADLSKPLMLVAKPELRDDTYQASVLVVAPLGGDAHVGFIVNRSTGTPLGALFPGHAPSQNVADPVYLGGPVATEAIFALVNKPQPGSGKTLQVAPGLFAAFDSGLRPGELDGEIERGAWYVLEPDAKLAMRKSDGLWEELVQRLKNRENTI